MSHTRTRACSPGARVHPQSRVSLSGSLARGGDERDREARPPMCNPGTIHIEKTVGADTRRDTRTLGRGTIQDGGGVSSSTL